MAKLKTFKALAKRMKVTKKGKVITRAKGQDHFNSSSTSKKTRNKRRDQVISKTVSNSIKKYL